MFYSRSHLRSGTVYATPIRIYVLSTLSMLLSMLQVLHMDRNDYYGGESASLSLNQVRYMTPLTAAITIQETFAEAVTAPCGCHLFASARNAMG